MGGGTRVIDGGDDVTPVSQRTGEPDLVAPVTSVPVREHQQRMLASRGRCVTNRSRPGKHRIIADQLCGGGGCTGVPDHHLQCAVIVRVHQRGRLEADSAFVSECDSRQPGQQQGAKSYFQCGFFLDPAITSVHSISTPVKALTAQGQVVDLHATDRVIVIVIVVFGFVLGLGAIAIVIAITFTLLIVVVF